MSGRAIAVEALSLTLGDFHLDKLSFALTDGEILVILGPNGAGKSVALETIAGFHRPSGGRVLIGGRDVTYLAPEHRNLGFVVQNFGLFPHLDVSQNVALALRHRRPSVAKAPRAATPPHGDVGALLNYFGVDQLAHRMPNALSPGEKQRVALARAVAAEPDVFLFDEPFSALDAGTRSQLCEELLAFLRALSIPAIFVTHDHVEAMLLADKVIVLRDGLTMQTGTPTEAFQKPANLFVAHFVGIENVLPARIVATSESYATVAIGEHKLSAAVPETRSVSRRDVHIAIRAETIELLAFQTREIAPSDVNRLRARVTGVRIEGPLAAIRLDCGFELIAYVLAPKARDGAFAVDREVDVEIPPATIHVLAD